MFARITTLQLKPGMTDDLIRIFQDVIALTIAGQKGFNGMTLLADPPNGRAIAIDLWKTEADLRAVERGGYEQQQLTKIEDCLAGPPVRQSYEVAVQVEMTQQGTAYIHGI